MSVHQQDQRHGSQETLEDIRLPKLAMPQRLVLMRHGESEGNLLQKAFRRREIEEYPEHYRSIPDRELRLSRLGREQAIESGPWLAERYPEGFDVIYVSDHVRAKETCALVCKAAGWEQAQIRIDPQLGERSWGEFNQAEPTRQRDILAQRKRDPLHATMPNGESLLATRLRSRTLLERCVREFSGQRVLVFSHGEYIEALWSEVAHFSTEQQRAFFKSSKGRMSNCQIVEFSAVDPDSGEYEGKLRWVRSSCPSRDEYGSWSRCKHRTFSPDEILEIVQKYPSIVRE